MSSHDSEIVPLLEVRGLSKWFPGVRALHRVDLTLARGEVLAVLGENGAGKSTLMKILAGIEYPDEGDIVIDGRSVRVIGLFARIVDGPPRVE